MTDPVRKKSETFNRDIDALFLGNHKFLYRAAYNVTGKHSEAEDAVQTIFLRLIRARELPKDFGRNPQGYLYRSVMNEALSIVRARARGKIADVDLESVDLAAPSIESSREDEIERMRIAMTKLKPDFVETLNLRYKQEYSCRQIAEIQGKPLGTVCANLLRARAEIKRLSRIQEKHGETQKKKHQANRRRVLADSSEPRDGGRIQPDSEPAAG